MNSFKFLGEGMAAEIEPSDRGARPTEGRCASRRCTTTRRIARCMRRRSKEEADDYRYFPEPDLVPLGADAAQIDAVREHMPELPAARQARFQEQFGLSAPGRDRPQRHAQIADYFEAVVAAGADPKAASDWVRNQPAIVTDLAPERIAALLELMADKTITATIAKQVLVLMQADPAAEPAALVESHGLASIGGEDELASLVDEVMAAHPRVRGAVPVGQGGRDQRVGGPGDEAHAGPRRRQAGAGAPARAPVRRLIARLGRSVADRRSRRARPDHRSRGSRRTGRGRVAVTAYSGGWATWIDMYPPQSCALDRSQPARWRAGGWRMASRRSYVETSNYRTRPAIRILLPGDAGPR